MTESLLRVRGLVRTYRGKTVLHGIDLDLTPGGTLGIVGESGSGKSTLARTVLGLERPQAGTVHVEGTMQAVFQDPGGSLDPRMTVAASVGEAVFRAPRAARRAAVRAALAEVGLSPALAAALPHELSGGQRQRVAIARALVARPALVVADEPLSALDVSVRAQIVLLLRNLRVRHGMGWLFISHDLGALRHLADETVVLREGRIVEQGPTARLLDAPQHPYTRELVAASLLYPSALSP